MSRVKSGQKKVMGWCEWVGLPDLKVAKIKAKVDSGARTSALHAEDVMIVKTPDGHEQAHFTIYPTKDRTKAIRAHAPLVDMRLIRSSIGIATMRPVICTQLSVNKDVWSVEITLIDRDPMGFRMLLGREAIKHGFVIDPAHMFLLKRKKLKKKVAQ